MFKVNIATKDGKTFKIESEAEALKGKKLGDKINGKDVSPDLEGYGLEITGASDKSGFTAMKDVEGTGLNRVLLIYGKAMKKRPRKEGKKKQLCKKPKGLRLRRTVRGNTISDATSQINLKILKDGTKKLTEIFPEQNKIAEIETEAPKEEVKVEDKPTENSSDNKSSKGREGGNSPAEEKLTEKKEEVKAEEKPAEQPKEETPRKEVKVEEKKE